MFGVASASAAYTAFLADASGLIGTTLVSVLGVVAGLLAIGWAFRFTKKHITGKKI